MQFHEVDQYGGSRSSRNARIGRPCGLLPPAGVVTVAVVRRIVVTGRVQGVGYRRWAEGEALRLGLDGWVRNRRDGSVEALVSGAPDALAAFFAACRSGPRGAAVADVTEHSAGDEPAPVGFRVLPTA